MLATGFSVWAEMDMISAFREFILYQKDKGLRSTDINLIYLSGIRILFVSRSLPKEWSLQRQRSYLLIPWVGKTKQNKQRSRGEHVRQRWASAQGSGPSTQTFWAPSLTLTPEVALLHFEVLLWWKQDSTCTFPQGSTGNVWGRTWSASSQLVDPATGLYFVGRQQGLRKSFILEVSCRAWHRGCSAFSCLEAGLWYSHTEARGGSSGELLWRAETGTFPLSGSPPGYGVCSLIHVH